MEKSPVKRVGLALLSAAVTFRLVSAAQQVLPPAWKELTVLTAQVATFTPPEQAPPDDRVWTVHILPKEETETEAEPAAFAAEEAAAIPLACNGSYRPDPAPLLSRPLSWKLPEQGVQILIVHTHTSEAYTQTAGWTYAETDPHRTTENDHSVVRVGQAVAQALENHGFSVLHDTTYHDYPDYNGAYASCLARTQSLLKENPAVPVILDLHRDAIQSPDGQPVSTHVTLPGGDGAQLMLVVGTDEGGLQHESWQDNLSFALKVQAAGNRLYPGLFRDINLRTERFNQHLAPGALLVEVGSAGNTLPQALLAAQALADCLAAVLRT